MYFKRASYWRQSPDDEIGIKELINLLNFTPIKPPEHNHFRALTEEEMWKESIQSNFTVYGLRKLRAFLSTDGVLISHYTGSLPLHHLSMAAV